MNYEFKDKSKFALLTLNGVYSDLPAAAFQLSEGTWVMPSVPVPDLDIWKEWIGSIRIEQLQRANLVFFVEESSANPESFDAVHERLKSNLAQLFSLLHLRSGLECASADLLCGSSDQGVPRLRQMSQLRIFYQSQGYSRTPVTTEWLEDTAALRCGVMAMEASVSEFQRAKRGLHILHDGLQQSGQDRLHQFVRSLEALILPQIGKTEKQFAHRCQTFARAGDDTRTLLLEAFAMRSDTEHVHPWDQAVQSYPANHREDICWQRTRQMERLACGTYSRILRNNALRCHFQSDPVIAAFWKLRDHERRALWGTPIDIAMEPLVQAYDQWGRRLS